MHTLHVTRANEGEHRLDIKDVNTIKASGGVTP